MPANVRQWARRKLEQSLQNLDWSATHIADVVVTYEKQHPEIAEPLRAILLIYEQCEDGVKKIRESF